MNLPEGFVLDTPQAPQGARSPYGGAISSIESGGRYDLLGPVTRKGDRAYGRYQVMGENIGPWSAEVFGAPLTPEQFLQSPQAQDAIFAHKFGQYVQRHGPEGAARAWFAGEGGMNDLGRRDQLGTSVGEYSRRFQAAMPQDGGAMAFAAPSGVGRAREAPAAVSSPGPAAGAIPMPQPRPPEAAAGGLPEGFVLDDEAPAPAQAARPPAPITGYPEHYLEARAAAGAQIDRGIGQLGSVGEDPMNAVWGAGNVGLGALGAITSPINAAYRNIVGQPVENLTGIPKEYTEFAAQLATPGLGMTRIGTTRVPVPSRSPTPGQEVAQAAERLSGSGAEVTVPRAVASDSPTIQRAAQHVRNVPIGGSPVIQATQRGLEQLGTKTDEAAAAYGGASVPGAGGAARQSIVDWVGPESKAKVSAAYDAVDNAINPGVMTDLTKTRAMAGGIVARRAAAGDTSAGKAADFVSEAISRPGLTYHGIRDLRSRVGEMLEGGILPEGWSGRELKRLYGALTEDLGQAVENAGGPRAKALWERANRYTALVNDRREALAKIVGSNGDAPAETVFDRLTAMASSSSRADIERLAQARKVMDKGEWNDVASAAVSRLGRDVEGNFSPARFVSDWGKISDQGKNLLFRSGGRADLARNLDDIATISSRWKEVYQKFGNPSGTAQNVGFLGLGAGLMAEPMTTIGTVVGSRMLASALSRPATAASTAAFSRRYFIAATNPSAVTFAGLTTSARNLANTINSELGLSIKADDLLRSIQGAVPGRAGDEQQQPGGIVGQ